MLVKFHIQIREYLLLHVYSNWIENSSTEAPVPSSKEELKKRPSMEREGSVAINNMEDVYRRRSHRIFLKDYRQIRGKQRARMHERRERRKRFGPHFVGSLAPGQFSLGAHHPKNKSSLSGTTPG